jgi:hypothetical protein
VSTPVTADPLKGGPLAADIREDVAAHTVAPGLPSLRFSGP